MGPNHHLHVMISTISLSLSLYKRIMYTVSPNEEEYVIDILLINSYYTYEQQGFSENQNPIS